MYYVYILKSENEEWFYVGLTKDVGIRLKQHNSNWVRSTKAHAPFKLIYTKSFSTRIEARDHEKYLKVRSNKERLLKDLGYII